VEDYIKTQYPGIEKKFIVQEPREGTGHAVWLARDLILSDEEVIIALGDTIFDVSLKDVLGQPESSLGVKKVNDPRNFGVAELDSVGYIRHMVEKPPIPKSNLALVGLYKIRESKLLLESLNHIIKKNLRTHGEFQLTDAIMRMVEKGAKIRTFPVENWYDCGNKESLLETNAVLLRKTSNTPTVNRFENTILIPPVVIAEHCHISNSIIGPNVSIGDHSTIRYSILKDAIIGSYSEIENAVLHHSVIGSDATLRGQSQSLNLGDSTEIDFG